jgi:hypothetical protein
MQHVSIFALKLVEFVFLLLLSRFIVIASYRTYCRCTLNLPCNAVLCSPFFCIVLYNGCVPLVLYFRSWIHGTSGMLEFALATPADATEGLFDSIVLIVTLKSTSSLLPFDLAHAQLLLVLRSQCPSDSLLVLGKIE